MNIRETIISEAEKRQWSAYKLAQAAGLKPRTVQRYFAGDRDLTGGFIEKLCAALGLQLRGDGRKPDGEQDCR